MTTGATVHTGAAQAWNAGREAARDALEAAEARGELR
jgi:hypothetical protein